MYGMNKSEQLDYLSDKLGVSKAQAGQFLDAYVEMMTEAISNNDGIRISGFGTFTKRHRAQREGRNPSTGEAITIAAQNSVGFTASKALKEAVN